MAQENKHEQVSATDCTICNEPFCSDENNPPVTITASGRTYCKDCIVKWVFTQENNSDPITRHEISEEPLNNFEEGIRTKAFSINYTLKDAIEAKNAQEKSLQAQLQTQQNTINQLNVQLTAHQAVIPALANPPSSRRRNKNKKNNKHQHNHGNEEKKHGQQQPPAAPANAAQQPLVQPQQEQRPVAANNSAWRSPIRIIIALVVSVIAVVFLIRYVFNRVPTSSLSSDIREPSPQDNSYSSLMEILNDTENQQTLPESLNRIGGSVETTTFTIVPSRVPGSTSQMKFTCGNSITLKHDAAEISLPADKAHKNIDKFCPTPNGKILDLCTGEPVANYDASKATFTARTLNLQTINKEVSSSKYELDFKPGPVINFTPVCSGTLKLKKPVTVKVTAESADSANSLFFTKNGAVIHTPTGKKVMQLRSDQFEYIPPPAQQSPRPRM